MDAGVRAGVIIALSARARQAQRQFALRPLASLSLIDFLSTAMPRELSDATVLPFDPVTLRTR
jgi:hypothetical protein